jgi:hypothetical protein
MEKDDQKPKFSFHRHENSNVNPTQLHIDDAAAKENLASILQNLTSLRRIQESSLKSVSEESFTSSTSCAKKTFTTMASSRTSSSSSSSRETTGGNEMLTDEDKKQSSTMMELGACPIGKTMLAHQHQQQQMKQQQNIASSSSSIASSATETAMRKTKTLSFLHNEDLFTTGTTMISGGNSSSNSLYNDEKLVPTASHLFRSISFQEQRRQYQKSSLQRTESGREYGDVSGLRKMAILSPKHSLQELNERIKQQQMRMQQQMFYGSSELSLK